MSTFRVQRAVRGGPGLSHGRMNLHLHKESVRETAPFMCGSEGRLPVSMCMCDLRKRGVWFQHPCCLHSDFLVSALPFLGGMQVFPNTSRRSACYFLCFIWIFLCFV